MHDINVLFLSRITLPKDMGNVKHSHDYWHFSISLNGSRVSHSGNMSTGFLCSCNPPNMIHSGFKALDEQDSINVMFRVNNKQLERRMLVFPFTKLTEDQAFTDILSSIVDRAVTFQDSASFIDAAFNYYIELVLCANAEFAQQFIAEDDIVSKCMEYIEENYSRKLKVEEIAQYVQKTPNYVSSIFSSTMGITLVEYMNSVKIRKACSKIAYTEDDIETISIQCGFENYKNFCRVFKNIVGLTPSKYRTSHVARDMRYFGEWTIPDEQYKKPVFTYIPGAQKCIYWKNPAEYMSQKKR